MTAALAGFLSAVLPYLAGAAAIIAAAIGSYLHGRSSGRQDARAEARDRDIENRETRDAVDRDIGRGADGDAARRLRERWRR